MSATRIRRAMAGVATLCLAAISGCVDETVVFDRDLFEEPLEAAGDFLGYTDHATKLTACGNCHIGPQGQWEETAHAAAWDGLQASGHAQGFCEGCHTVSELGNAVTAMAGYNATEEERYEDVQCESCHGPGLAHALDPRDETVPLAAMDVGLDLTLGCAECHQGDHHPFAEEWSESGHGSVVTRAADRGGSCESCHTGEGALRMFGVSTTYVEEALVDTDGEHLAITCAVCHDPHGSDNSAQLRFPIDEPNEEVNLCMQCHQKRAVPDPTRAYGPHSPEGPTLLGTAGWRPTGLSGPIVSTHGDTAENPRLCAGCHVNAYEIDDDVTGEFVFNSTGHRFEATPCVDEQGVPTAGPCDNADKTYVACLDCHSELRARELVDGAEDGIALEVATLRALVEDAEANHPEDFDTTDNEISVGEGARFNLQLAETPGAVVHNAALVRALLTASIAAMEAEYPAPRVP